MKLLEKKLGLIIIIIGVLHFTLGMASYFNVFGEMVSEGLVNTGQSLQRSVAFWFTYAGIFLFLLGYIINYLEKNGLKVPVNFGWFLLISAVIGAIVYPISGFWLLFIPAILALIQKRTIIE